MKLHGFLFILALLSGLIFAAGMPAQEYIIIGWNDLGMHCANQDFQTLAILPPYNNLSAQVVRVGGPDSLPQLVTAGFKVTYEIPGNTYSVGKTNFWDYEFQLFGVELPDNTGLTGAGLSGEMQADSTHFSREGIPITPYPDNDWNNEHPYQLALLKLYDNANVLLAQTEPVIPVSNEINCVSSGCHSSESQILQAHEDEGGFNPNNTPILCAECHADNALNMPGQPGVPPFSQVIHEEHAETTNNCYKCHPGPNTQCLRGIMYQKGLVCQDCHGGMTQVAQSIENGREPWLEEPSCGATICHGSQYGEEPGKLFRQSRGHGGLFCSACHGSPHAILPTVQANDNVQNTNLQGYAGTLSECVVCHGTTPQAPGPHGFLPTSIRSETSPVSATLPGRPELGANYPNPFNPSTTIPFRLSAGGRVKLAVYNVRGQQVATLIERWMSAGAYSITFSAGDLPSGVYLYRMSVNGWTAAKQFMLLK